MMLRVLCALALLLAAANADLYMHNPPGCNDRNRERNDNRNNANRLFDSQNNAAGGYHWRGDATATNGDPITYYHGSKLRVEWTAQHQCGSGDSAKQNVHCQLILQYACESDMPALRDGYPEGAIVESDNNNAGYKRRAFSGRGGQNADGTERIPDDRTDPEFYNPGLLGGIEFGYHESISSYTTCKTTTRNKGLYTSDQKLQGNDARFTRQNPNGGRRGLECPEERDYYPYWRPSQFHDLALLVSDTKWCDYYQAKSQNVAPVSFCQCSTTCRQAAPNQLIPITQGACTAAGGSWQTTQRTGEPAPECLYHPFSRDNHLGNVAQVDGDGNLQTDASQPETAHYNLEIPERMGSQLCIVRLRYNMSTGDYPDMDFANPGTQSIGFDASKNCPRITQGGTGGVDDGSGNTVDNPQCTTSLTLSSRPLYNRPYVQVFDSTDPKLSLAINTHQTGRTFQDRSYVFRVAPKPDGVGTVWNLNVRGRRGNIVQAYPSVEYDFVPNFLSVTQGDFLHIQIHGSDYNEAKNANNGEGWQYSDRSNIVQSEDRHLNYPLFKSQVTMFDSLDIAKRWALLEQDPATCKEYKDGDANEQNSIDNCGKLNRAPARFPNNVAKGLVQMNNAGTFQYFSSRNNNFSNRSQKATISVSPTGLSAAAIAGIVIGSLAGAAMLTAGVCFYGKRNPNTVAGAMYSKTAGGCFSRGSSSTSSSSSASLRAAPAPDMEYTRH